MLFIRKNKMLQCNKGVTAIEYALFAFLIAFVILASLRLTGNNLSELYCTIANRISGNSACPQIGGPLPPVFEFNPPQCPLSVLAGGCGIAMHICPDDPNPPTCANMGFQSGPGNIEP